MNRPVDVPLVGDLRAIVPQLTEALRDTPRTPSPELARWIERRCRPGWQNWPKPRPAGMSPVHPARLIVEATRVFPADGIMVRDGGATTIFGWTYSQAKPHDVMWNQNFGHLGTGLPYAIGASVADGRRRPVMLITGDSSFLFHMPELETAARLGLPLVCVVAVDYAWGLEVGVYKRTFGPGSRETGVHWSTENATGPGGRGIRLLTANTPNGTRTSPRRSSAPTPAASPAWSTWPSTPRPTPRKCPTTTNSVPGTPRACSDHGYMKHPGPLEGVRVVDLTRS